MPPDQEYPIKRFFKGVGQVSTGQEFIKNGPCSRKNPDFLRAELVFRLPPPATRGSCWLLAHEPAPADRVGRETSIMIASPESESDELRRSLRA